MSIHEFVTGPFDHLADESLVFAGCGAVVATLCRKVAIIADARGAKRIPV